MNSLIILLAVSFLEWYIIDKIKGFWNPLKCHSLITFLVSLALSMTLTFSLGLDILLAFGFVNQMTIAGQILTGLLLSSGSSAVTETIEHFERQ